MNLDTFTQLTENALLVLIAFTVVFLIRAFSRANKEYKQALKREHQHRSRRSHIEAHS
jgi:hypothetical protein